MPPKKKAPAKAAQKSDNLSAEQKIPQQQVQQKPSVQPTVTKQQKPLTNVSPTVQIKQSKAQHKSQVQRFRNILSSVPKQLTQQEILRLRRQKFKSSQNKLPTEDPQVRQQRMRKFGIQPKQSKQQIQQRKRKFGNTGTPILTQDEEVLRLRRMKFANNGFSGASIATESADVLQERKRKFAKKQQNLISLDDEIEKSKHKNKFDKGNRRDRRDRKGLKRRDNRDRKFRRRQDRKGSKQFKGQRKSRTEIFGKRKFIKRFSKKGNNRNANKQIKAQTAV